MTTTTMTPARRITAMTLCLLTMILAILDGNIVSAAIVPIVGDLDPADGVGEVSWLVAGFTLAATVMLPFYGRLCDTLGAKRVLIGALTVFLVGSALCGTSQTMTELIVFRALQGSGAGGLMSVTMVVMAQLSEPGKNKGPGALAGLMAGFGMAIGPLVGGLFADSGDWRWIFYINLPLGVVIIAGLLWAVRIPRQTTRTSLDLVGAALVAGFAGALLTACEWGGSRYAWDSPTIIGLGVVSVICLALFIWRQATTDQPILPLSLFTIPALRSSYLIQGLIGVAMTGSMVYLMVYLQVARGVSAANAGAYLAFMAGGLIVSGLFGAKLGWATRTYMLVGTGCVTVALCGLAFIGAHSSLWLIRADLVLMGLGFGQLLGRLITVVQAAAPLDRLGVATTSIRFFQSLGAAVGTAGFGSLLNAVFRAKSAGANMATAATHPHALTAFISGVDAVFAAAAVITAIAMALSFKLKQPPTPHPTPVHPQPAHAP